jgi:hypothetical protein
VVLVQGADNKNTNTESQRDMDDPADIKKK